MFNGVREFSDTLIRTAVNFILLPYKAFVSVKAIFVTLYRLIVSKKNLLEWVTAADAEKMLGNDVRTYARQMIVGPVTTLVLAVITLFGDGLTLWQLVVLFVSWYVAPFVALHISKGNVSKGVRQLEGDEKDELTEIAKRTWLFFETFLSEKNNFLMPDNYDASRKEELTNYTSSTNIGLSLMAVVSAYNFGFVKLKDAIFLIFKIVCTIENLDKWNGHLYNWYNVKSLRPLKPEFVSAVDSGNLVGYLFAVLGFLEEAKSLKENALRDRNVQDRENLKKNEEQIVLIIDKIRKIIEDTDFSKLYDYDKNLFSIGFDVQANRLIDSYYDLLASEARLASFVAIAKGDIPYKHWFCLGRTCTRYEDRYGLVSWSGTMFEYLMPNVVMKSYRNSLLEMSCDFAIFSQMEYGRKLNIPWGISESAFALKDLKYNYQYKAVGVPWLGLKRGINEDVVVSPYSSLMALEFSPDEVFENIYELKDLKMFSKFGFYEAVDFTPSRVQNKKVEVVKTYMAHHQALILLSINNFLNGNVLRRYFESNAEVLKAQILLQEKAPQMPLFANEKKDDIKKLKYSDFEEEFDEVINNSLENVNILTNNDHTLLVSGNGDGYSKFGDIFVTRFNCFQRQSNLIYVKNLQTNEFWSFANNFGENGCIRDCDEFLPKSPDEYAVSFSSHDAKFYRRDGNVETITRIMVSAEENVELRKVQVRNIGDEAVDINVVSYVEFILSRLNADIAHPAYNSLFQTVMDADGNFVLEKRFHNGEKVFASFFAVPTSDHSLVFEFETDKMNFVGRCNGLECPAMLTDGVMFSNKFGQNVNPIVASKTHVRLEAKEFVEINFYVVVSYDLGELLETVSKYKSRENENRLVEIAKSRALIENRFYDLKKGKICLFNRLFAEIFFGSSTRSAYGDLISRNVLSQSGLWKFGVSGDVPIVLVMIRNVNDVYVVKELIDAIRYFKLKNLDVDLVILNGEVGSERYVYDAILRYVNSHNASYLFGANGGVHVVDAEKVNADEEALFFAVADVIFDAKKGAFREQLGGFYGN